MMVTIKTSLRFRRGWALLGAGLFAISCGYARAATITANSPSRADVNAAISSATDGDTVIIPAGTATWSSGAATITHAITIQGQTTTDITNGTANDQTVLIDGFPRPGNDVFFRAIVTTGTLVRFSGITFQGAGQPAKDGAVITIGGGVGGSTTPLRVDHCHFAHVNISPMVGIYGQNFGVADHNVFDGIVNGFGFTFEVQMYDYRGQTEGDGAFAESAGFGGPNFFFIEDNYIHVDQFAGGIGSIDSFFGAKYVFRHNRIWNMMSLGHSTGTSSPRGRGVRATENYSNEMHFDNTTGTSLDGGACGNVLVHDNTMYDTLMSNGWGLAIYREFGSGYTGAFHGADGSSPWDYNVTEADGTHVDGHPPYLFESGTFTLATYPTFTDTTKNWTTNQWVGYSVKRTSDGAFGIIVSNTNHTLTIYDYGNIPSTGWSGATYEIHKVLRVLDQPGIGRGDRISGATPLNTVTGTAKWPSPDSEPSYSWNNVHSPDGQHLNFSVNVNAPTIVQGRDYYNDTPMPGYTPYTYPHPLVSGSGGDGPGAPEHLHVLP